MKETILRHQCAWCKKVKLGGLWFDIGLPVVIHQWRRDPVSHGICPACQAKVMATYSAALARPA